MAPVSFPRRFADLAVQRPNEPAVTCGDSSVTWAELDARSTQLAHAYASRGVTYGSMVTIALKNSVEWLIAALAVWKLGAVPQPVSAQLPEPELRAILDVAKPALVIGVDAGWPFLPEGFDAGEFAVAALPDVVSPSWKAPTSGGSTGRPKLIVSGDPAEIDLDVALPFGMQADGCLLMPGPLYHNGPLVWSVIALLAGNHVVLLPRFRAEATLAAVEHHRANQIYLVPTMMKRIWRCESREQYDVSCLELVWHSAEPCAAWLKEAWIDWLGPSQILEIYGATEGQAYTLITGDEWLAHRGSVGRPVVGEMAVFDEHGRPVPAGVPGEVWFRPPPDRKTYEYVGAEPRTRDGGWECLGDHGYLDDEGYLYLNDRAEDMILVGGANVFPAEVEAALLEHPAVRSCAVIGLPDEDKGSRVHAIVEASALDVCGDDLIDFVAQRIARYKLPRTVEFVSSPLRSDAGKVRRRELREVRLAQALA